ncbi:MAG: hypothetical protein WC390_08980 [Sulfurimonas sp.]|jgi:Skp family chaperone for outer membrane proteins
MLNSWDQGFETNAGYTERKRTEAYNEWIDKYYTRYLSETTDYTDDDRLSKSEFYSELKKGKADLEGTFQSILTETEKNKATRTSQEEADAEEAQKIEDLKYKPTEEETIFENRLKEIIGKGEPTKDYESVEYDPETAKKWYAQLSESEKPLEEEANRKLSEYYASVNPYGRGGGGEVRAASATNQGITNERWGRAYDIGQAEYEKKYTEKYNEYMRKYNELQNAYSTLNSIGMTKNSADRSTALAQLNRLWSTSDTEYNRLYNEAQDVSEERYYTNVANSMNSGAKEWWEYALPAATKIATAVTSPSASTVAGTTSAASTSASSPVSYYEQIKQKYPWLYNT